MLNEKNRLYYKDNGQEHLGKTFCTLKLVLFYQFMWLTD